MKIKEARLGNDDEINVEDLFEFPDEDQKGYYEYNRESPNVIHIDEKENAIDSLETALSFLIRDDNLKWKWVVLALHHSLYSFCISALEHGNYENVLSRKYGEDDDWIVHIGKDSPRKSKIVPFYIKEYKTPAYRIEWELIDKNTSTNTKKTSKKQKEKLINFWTALARVQDNYFWMGRYFNSKAVEITDEELHDICWLSEKVRNDLMHFIPKGYSIDILSIINATKVVLKVIYFLVFESFTINFLDYEKSQKRIKEALELINVKLNVAEEIIHLHIIRENHRVIKKR